MAASLRTRKKASAQKTIQELTLFLAKAVGIDLTQEYDPDAFASLAVDMYQSSEPEVYTEQGQYLYNILQNLYAVTPDAQETNIPVERTTKVWFKHNRKAHDLTYAEFVDVILKTQQELLIDPIVDSDEKSILFVAVDFAVSLDD